MRLVAWNLNGDGLRKVPMVVERLQPDVLITPECADPAGFPPTLEGALSSSAFIGPPGQKGLSVLGFGDYEVQLASLYNPEHLRIAPIEVDGPDSFHLLAVWADNSARDRRPAIDALATYREWLSSPSAIVAGDFNEGPQWDRPGPLGWSAMVETLSLLGLRSVTPGDAPTFFMYRHLDRPYVVDHAFVGDGWEVSGIDIGDPNPWLEQSDHMPVVVDLNSH